jgi:hypothetical protein
VASSTACGAADTFESEEGYNWAHLPCKDKPTGKPPKGAQVKLSFEEYLDAHSYTVMHPPNVTAAGTNRLSVPRPSSTINNLPGKAAYKTKSVGEQNHIRVRNLVDVSAALNGAGCVHHLIDGTLLGLTRSRALISHDSDDDLAVYGCANDASLAAVFAKLEPQGFTLCRSDKQLWSVCRHGAYIDLEHWHVDGRLCKYEDNWMVLPCSLVFPIVKMLPIESTSAAPPPVATCPGSVCTVEDQTCSSSVGWCCRAGKWRKGACAAPDGAGAERESWPVPLVPAVVLRIYYGKGWRVPSSFHASKTSASAADKLARQHPPGAAQLAAALSQGFSLAL